MREHLRTSYTKDLMEEVGVSTGFRLIVSSDTYSLPILSSDFGTWERIVQIT